MLDSRDSNTRWVGEPGAVVSGGVAVSGWYVDSGDPDLIRAGLPAALAGSPPPRQLYVNGAKAAITVTNASVVGLTAAAGAVLTDAGLTTPSKVPLQWDARGQQIEIRHDSAYPQSRCAVRAVRFDNNGTHIDVAQPCWSFGRLLGQMDFPSVVLNAESQLQIGQWQPVQNGLRYRPRSAMEKAGLLSGSMRASVPMASVLLDLEMATAVEISGITFVQSAWNAPSSDDGYLERCT
jgi:hypothetical protein